MSSTRRRMLMQAGGSPTPPMPYQRVEYLESSGSQYIDTLLYPKCSEFKFEMEYADIANHNIRVGCRENSTGGGFWFCNGGITGNKYNNWAIQYAGQVSYSSCQNDGLFHTVEMDDVVTFDGTPIITFNSSTFQNTNTFTLFCANQGNTKYYGHMKIKWFKAYVNNVLTINAIAVRDGTMGEMYDQVSQSLLPRVGTFIIGPDIN